MAEIRTKAVCVGEAAFELTRGSDGRLAEGCGGDVFNTAVYLARAGIDTAFATAVGDDPYSDRIVALATAEGIDSRLMLRTPGRLPALSIVERDAGGRAAVRSWGEGSPARELFERPDWGLLGECLMAAGLVYFSGQTLSLYSNVGLGRFLALLEAARQKGARAAFDANFRPHGWRGDLARARTVAMEALKRTDIALPAYDDEAVLWGDPSPEATVARIQAFGVAEIVVKNGPGGALVAAAGRQDLVPVPEVVTPADATAAGDSFNAAYLAARLNGKATLAAAAEAHRLAGRVIRHHGAILPRPMSALH